MCALAYFDQKKVHFKAKIDLFLTLCYIKSKVTLAFYVTMSKNIWELSGPSAVQSSCL